MWDLSKFYRVSTETSGNFLSRVSIDAFRVFYFRTTELIVNEVNVSMNIYAMKNIFSGKF